MYMQKRFIKNYSRNFKKVNKKEPFLGQNRTGPKCAGGKKYESRFSWKSK